MNNHVFFDIDHALRELGHAIQVPLAFNEHRVVTIECKHDVLCSIEAPNADQFVYFHAPIMRVPAADQEDILRQSLSLNLFTLALPGATIALDATTDELLLCHTAAAAGLTPDHLANLITVIVEQVANLRNQITSKASPSSRQ